MSSATVERVDLHIGVEKTGSTTLQAGLAAARDALLDLGVLYPTATGAVNHEALAIIGRDDGALDDLRRRRGLTTPADVQGFRDLIAVRLEEEAAIASPSRVLLSNEHCSSRLQSKDEVSRLVDWLRARFPDADLEVFVYLRRQDLMHESRHSTAVRMGAVEALVRPTSAEVAKLYDFASLLDRWSEVVGREHLHPRRFGRERLVGGDVVVDFLDAVGLSEAEIPPVGRENTALDAATQQFMGMLNAHIPRFGPDGARKLHARVLEAADRLPVLDGPARLSSEDAVWLLAQVHDGNRVVATEWFGDEVLFSDGGPERGSGAPLDVERSVEIAAGLIRDIARGPVPAATSAAERAAVGRSQALEAELRTATKQARDEKARVEALLSSRTFRLGHGLLSPVRRLRRWFRRLRV